MCICCYKLVLVYHYYSVVFVHNSDVKIIMLLYEIDSEDEVGTYYVNMQIGDNTTYSIYSVFHHGYAGSSGT